MKLAAKPFQSPPDMLSWQYRSILEELGELQRHAADPTCPCTQADKGEYCLPKHALGLHVLAKETAAMDSRNQAWLTDLAEEALEQHHALKDRIVCGKQHRDERDTEEWARSWRKRVEPIYYACKVKLAQPAVLELAQSILAPSVAIRGTCTENKCSLKVKAATEVKREVGSIAALPAAVQQVQDALEAQKGPKASDKTFAIGPTSLTRYQFRYRLVEAKDLLTSHNPDTFQIEPRYPQELQPRLRERAATQLQVTQMAANIDPDSLLTEFHSIDRGAPIVGSDNIVESGNGRIMAVKRAVAHHPDSYNRYRQALRDKSPQYALSPETVDRMTAPVLVRERLSQVDRRTFALEANAATTIAPSAIETARTDAKLINLADLNGLQIADGQGLADALKHRDNLAFVRAFTGRLPQNEQARMVDAQGQLNQEGVRRMTLALFVATFPGDAGLRLAEKFFEATDNELRNVLNGITLALGPLAQAEALARDGKRDRQLAISEDLAKSVEVLAAIKSTPGMTVEKYLAQSQLFERQLSPFQERLMAELASRSRSGRAIGGLLRSYAQSVMDSPPPQQAGLLDMPRLTKDEVLAMATARQSDILRMAQEILMAASKRYYVSGNTYPVKDRLRTLGLRWDPERKQWWIDNASTAAKAQAIVSGPAPRPSKPASPAYNAPPAGHAHKKEGPIVARAQGKSPFRIGDIVITTLTAAEKQDLEAKQGILATTVLDAAGKAKVVTVVVEAHSLTNSQVEDFDAWSYQHTATVRLATPKEASPVVAERAEQHEKAQKAETFRKLPMTGDGLRDAPAGSVTVGEGPRKGVTGGLVRDILVVANGVIYLGTYEYDWGYNYLAYKDSPAVVLAAAKAAGWEVRDVPPEIDRMPTDEMQSILVPTRGASDAALDIEVPAMPRIRRQRAPQPQLFVIEGGGRVGRQAALFQQPAVCQSLANVAADEGKAGDAYRGIAFAARNEGMGDVARRLLGIARMEDRHLATIRGLIDRNCQGVEHLVASQTSAGDRLVSEVVVRPVNPKKVDPNTGRAVRIHSEAEENSVNAFKQSVMLEVDLFISENEKRIPGLPLDKQKKAKELITTLQEARENLGQDTNFVRWDTARVTNATGKDMVMREATRILTSPPGHAEMRDPILATIAAQICSTGACFANSPKLSCGGKS